MEPEDVVVSRKTPRDGKLEIDLRTAEVLRGLGGELRVRVRGETDVAAVEEIPCNCEKASAATHVHHFLASPLLRSLVSGTTVRLGRDVASPGLVTIDHR